MLGQPYRQQQKPSAAGGVLAAAIIGVWVMYQVAQHVMRSDDDTPFVEDDDETCPAFETADMSPKCKELQTFRSWRDRSAGASPIGAQLGDFDEEGPEALSLTGGDFKPKPWRTQATEASEAAESKEQATFAAAQPAEATAEPTEMTSWGKDLMEFEHKLEHQMHAREEEHRRSHLEHRAAALAAARERLAPMINGIDGAFVDSAALLTEKLDVLLADFHNREDVITEHLELDDEASAAAVPAISADDNLMGRSSALLKEVTTLGYELCSEPRTRGRVECIAFIAEIEGGNAAAAGRTRLAQKLEDMREQSRRNEKKREALEKHREMDAHVAEFAHELCAGLHDYMYLNCLKSVGPTDIKPKMEAAHEPDAFTREFCKEPSRHDYPMCRELHRGERSASRHSAMGLANFQEHMDQLSREHRAWDQHEAHEAVAFARQLCSGPGRQSYAVCKELQGISGVREAPHLHHVTVDGAHELEAKLKAMSREHQKWDHEEAAEAVALAKKLCAEPGRQSYAACKHFHPEVEHHELEDLHEKLHSLAKEHHEWDESEANEAVDFIRKLCAEPGRETYHACEQFHKAGSATAAEPMPAASGRGLRGTPTVPTMRWAQVAQWRDALTDLQAEAAVVWPAELRGARWEGRVPKVTCVTAIPTGRGSTASWVKPFVDTFLALDYEGNKQLILVYHADDTKVAAEVARLADGQLVKGVEAHGDTVSPSTTAFRYGAWMADRADVVARWDFYEYHAPHRLSAQVHAMAATARPACVLARRGNGADEVGGESSLVGEAKWMRENWYPLLGAGKEEEAMVSQSVVEKRAKDAAFEGQFAPHLIVLHGNTES